MFLLADLTSVILLRPFAVLIFFIVETVFIEEALLAKLLVASSVTVVWIHNLEVAVITELAHYDQIKYQIANIL